MKILELFAGTGSFSRVAEKMGHDIFTSDWDESFITHYTVDIMEFDITKLPWKPDLVWASPPCETFSVASIGHHWTGGNKAYEPKTQRAAFGKMYVEKTLAIIEELDPQWWVIENPRGLLRKMPFMEGLPRYTVTYCQYGDTRMKPTDIWTDIPWIPRTMCKNGDSCHVAAPRGARTGTQGIKSYKDRSRVPEALCEEILEAIVKRKEVGL